MLLLLREGLGVQYSLYAHLLSPRWKKARAFPRASQAAEGAERAQSIARVCLDIVALIRYLDDLILIRSRC